MLRMTAQRQIGGSRVNGTALKSGVPSLLWVDYGKPAQGTAYAIPVDEIAHDERCEISVIASVSLSVVAATRPLVCLLGSLPKSGQETIGSIQPLS